MKYYCPHCGKEIKEVNVIELTWRKVLLSVGLGVGSGLLTYPLLRESRLLGAVGAFVFASLVAFLVLKERT